MIFNIPTRNILQVAGIFAVNRLRNVEREACPKNWGEQIYHYVTWCTMKWECFQQYRTNCVQLWNKTWLILTMYMLAYISSPLMQMQSHLKVSAQMLSCLQIELNPRDIAEGDLSPQINNSTDAGGSLQPAAFTGQKE